ncbi:MAG: maltokinase N-terminal cap-like domain-containing protein [Micromonosporaceae bacterium]
MTDPARGSPARLPDWLDALTPQLTDALAEWLPEQRWFAAKHRQISVVSMLQQTPIPAPAGVDLVHAVLRVWYADEGAPDTYQVFIGFTRQLSVKLEHVRITDLPDGWICYDGLWDETAVDQLMRLMKAAATAGQHQVVFVPEPGATTPSSPDGPLPSRVVESEQSNTSVVYDDAAILKVFRRVTPGTNPDLEINRVLGRAGNEHVARLLGGIEGELDGQVTSYGMLSEYVENSADGWSMALASVRDLLADGDLHPDEVGADFGAEAHRLGEAVAAVHADLARTLGVAVLDAEGLATLADRMTARAAAAIRVVPELETYQEFLTSAYAALAEVSTPVPIQRIHGDLHLGQVLRTPTRWLLIDFEGEPATPLPERTRLDSPLRDVAGMLRSFEYAAAQLLLAEERDPLVDLAGNAIEPGHDDRDAQLRRRTQEWTERNRGAFCDGYAEGAGAHPNDQLVILRAYELDKAVYETVYEARNRPQWLPVPLHSISALVARHATP